MSEIGIPNNTVGLRYGGEGIVDGALGLAQVGMRVEGDGNGFVQITAQYYHADERDGADPTPTPLSQTGGIPKPGDDFLGGFVHKVSKTYGKGRSEMITFEIVALDSETLSGNASKTVPVVEGTSTLSTEPIQTHPDFESLLAGTYKEPVNGSRWNPRDNSFVGFVEPTDAEKSAGASPSSMDRRLRLVGVKSYYSPQVVVRGHYFEQPGEGAGISIAKKSGTYSYDGKFAGFQLIPDDLLRSYPSKFKTETGFEIQRSWLLSTVGIERFAQGKICKVTFECILSGVFGWNPWIYTEENQSSE